ncbi:LysR family transcriptional regulator [Paenarthrobacter sp. DKR-5]|uniref:LysR family transcriptional regulator n=1 Tax=Paenarthrobacter sp. DKR-5 TaxID=2835535 RepID=UPI001BDD5C7E|nr:LysR family transcriptional regulator [Paenarthrobacter sp. DKR-5]MBT1002845.1 LysR family transcriptional regulator [Paenarthrobacter sp. DKR-5]
MNSEEARPSGPLHRDVARLLPYLPVLDAVGQTRHVTAAAELLGLPQPTVSRALARASAVVGTELVRKQGRGISLTPAAEALLPAVRTALAQLQLGVDALHSRREEARGLVRVAFQNTFGEATVPLLVRRFSEQHPAVRFQLRQGSRSSCLDALGEDKADVAIVSPVPPAGRDQGSEVLYREPVRLVVPRGHRLARGSAVDLAEVRGEPFVMLERGFGMRGITDALCRQAGFKPAVAFEGQDSHTLRGLVAAGLGVAVLPPSRSEHPNISAPGLGFAELRLRDEGAFREIGLVWRTALGEPPQVALFRGLVLGEGRRMLRTMFQEPGPHPAQQPLAQQRPD